MTSSDVVPFHTDVLSDLREMESESRICLPTAARDKLFQNALSRETCRPKNYNVISAVKTHLRLVLILSNNGAPTDVLTSWIETYLWRFALLIT